MKRRYVTNFIVLDTEGWADRTQPLTANEAGWNPDTAECRIGPGMWEDLAPEPTTPGESTPTGIPYVFDTSTSDLGMTAGLRINSTFAQTATKVWIGNSDANTESQEVLLGLFTSGLLTCFRQSSPGSLIYKVTRMEAKSGYFEFDVTYVSGTRPGSGEVLYAHVAPDAPSKQVYHTVLSQAGTDAPGAAELQNSLKVPVSWSYNTGGTYLLDSEDGAPLFEGIVSIEIGPVGFFDDPGTVQCDIISPSQIRLITAVAGTEADGLLVNTAFRITITPAP